MDIEILTLQYGEHQDIEINDSRLLVFKNGSIFRFTKCGYWKYIHNVANTTDGYNYIGVGNMNDKNKRMIQRHRIMGYAFLNLDIENSKLEIDHIDVNRINNHISNLRIVSKQQNQFNRTKAKGFHYNKRIKKYQAYIGVNSKMIFLGLYTTEEEAHQAYLNAKIIYHPINNNVIL